MKFCSQNPNLQKKTNFLGMWGGGGLVEVNVFLQSIQI